MELGGEDPGRIAKVKQIGRQRVLRYLSYLNIAIALGYVGLLVVAARQDLLWRADFTAYYTGAAMMRDGDGARLYDLDLQTAYQQRILDQRSFLGGLLPYNSPPHLALFLVALSNLPLSTAFWVWAFLNILMTAWVLACVWRLADSWPPDVRWLFLSCILALPSLFRTLVQGTTTLVALVCVLQIYRAMRDGEAISAGAWLVIGTLRPQAVFSIGFFALVQRWWRILLSTSVFALSLIGFTSLLLGAHVWRDFAVSVVHTGQLFDQLGVYPEAMPNLRGVLSLLLGPDQGATVNVLSWCGFFLYLLAMVWLWRGKAQPGTALFDLKLALGLTLGIFFNFHLNPHDMLLLVVPFLLLLLYLHMNGFSVTGPTVCLGCLPGLLFVSEFHVADSLGVLCSVAVTLGLALWISVLLHNEFRRVRL